MIIVHGTFPVKAEVRDDALKLMERMSIASRAETGCISYEFYVGLTDPDTLLLFQEWESIEALQNHFETDHMEDFLKVLPDVLAGEVATKRYEVRAPDNSREPRESHELVEEPQFIVTREKIIH